MSRVVGFYKKNGKTRPITRRSGKLRAKEDMKMPRTWKDIDIQEKNYGIKYIGNGHWELRLGNLTDAGWYWTGDESSMLSFLARLDKSTVRDAFLRDMKHAGLSWNDIKSTLQRNVVRTEDGLYPLSGDNSAWEFGSLDDSFSEDVRNFLDDGSFDIEEGKRDEIENAAYDYGDLSYDNFVKKYGDDYRKLMRGIVNNAKSLDDFLNKISSEDVVYDINEMVFNFVDEQASSAIGKAIENIKKKGK
jgi:hypothetical protein